ncbi:amyloid A4 extracellular domain protein, partial [Ancylostoma duodenale]
GEFKSEALQVPHDCRFSHVNSGESCSDYQHWRDEATKQCSAKTFNGKSMTVRSFAVLEPCSLDLFTGVEFVCCPTVGALITGSTSTSAIHIP